MEKRTHLYVSRKHFCLWLMAACMLASLVARIALFSPLDGSVWIQVVLPGTAAVLYALIAFCSGDEMLYRTSFPVWVMGLASLMRLYRISDHGLTYGLICVCVLFFCVVYTAITGGKVSRYCLAALYPAALLLLGYLGIVYRIVLWRLIPDALAVAGMMAMGPGIRVHTDEAFHPFPGDRMDGRRIRTAPVMEQIAPYFMVERNESSNLFSESVEITALEQYIRRKRKEGLTGLGVTHMMLIAYVRTVAKYPSLNRFIGGQKIYTHGEDIVLCMTVKKEMSTSAPDTVIKLHMNPRDTTEDLYRKFNEQVALAKKEMEQTSVDTTAGALLMIPGVFLRLVFSLLKLLDYYGLLPRFLLEVSPFHGSAYFTALGSLGIKPVYHHLYDFGTIPVFCAFGSKQKKEEIVNGEVVTRKYVDVKFTLDERICDGFYYASAIKYMLRLLRHPEALDAPPEEVRQDIP